MHDVVIDSGARPLATVGSRSRVPSSGFLTFSLVLGDVPDSARFPESSTNSSRLLFPVSSFTAFSCSSR